MSLIPGSVIGIGDALINRGKPGLEGIGKTGALVFKGNPAKILPAGEYNGLTVANIITMGSNLSAQEYNKVLSHEMEHVYQYRFVGTPMRRAEDWIKTGLNLPTWLSLSRDIGVGTALCFIPPVIQRA